MIFLFEQFAYSETYLQGVLPLQKKGGNWDLPKGFVTKSKSTGYMLDGVGYFYNKFAKDSAKNACNRIIFVLPKVFLEEGGKAFGKEVKDGASFSLENAPKHFLANLSMWVCSSIARYQKLHPNDREIESPNVRRFGSDTSAPTLIDVMNSMKQFYTENKNLFVFTAKNKHSGNNRIDWRRTVAHTQPFMQGDAPIYMELENKKKVFDLDDRLLVLYFSAMHYIEETFGFKMPHSEFYTPMRVNEFRRLLGHRGLGELRRIKHKYFADKFLKLYNIMKAFFEWGGNFSANDFSSEYLLTSKYNNVFEAMIDRLVGDGGKSIDSLKHNDDGKIIDHLYKEQSIIFASGDAEKIWHIGDSKYYQDPDDIKGESIAKQFTYAKNVIQDFFSPRYVNKETKNDKDNAKLHSKDIHSGVRYRDPLTEGYSVTPNFFIRGFLPKFDTNVDDDSQYKDAYFRPTPQEKGAKKGKDDERELFYLPEHEKVSEDNEESNINDYLWEKRNRHFKNRLFDRDTLLLQVYNVNFLYVLKAYTSKRSSLREDFKRDAREKFRKNFLKLLNEKYVFWAVWPNNGLTDEEFVDRHFKTLVGKIFKPVDLKCLILALERDFSDSKNKFKCLEENVFDKIKSDCVYFHVTPTDIFPVNIANLPEATFADGEIEKFDEQLYAYVIRRDIFESKKMGKKHSLPRTINGRKLTGAVLGDYDTKRMEIQKSPLDEYYYLPCKGKSFPHSC